MIAQKAVDKPFEKYLSDLLNKSAILTYVELVLKILMMRAYLKLGSSISSIRMSRCIIL